MKTPNLNGLLIYTSRLNETEIYVLVDDSTMKNIQSITEAYIVDGQVFISLASLLNIEFDEKIIKSIIQNTDEEIVVQLYDRSVETETLDAINHSVPKDYTLSSIHIDSDYDDYGAPLPGTLNIVYRKDIHSTSDDLAALRELKAKLEANNSSL